MHREIAPFHVLVVAAGERALEPELTQTLHQVPALYRSKGKA